MIDGTAHGPAANALPGHELPAYLQAVLDCVVAFVGILTPDGILIEANEPALQAAGLKRADVIGKPFWDCHWWNFDAAIQTRLREAMTRAASGEHVRYDTNVRVANDADIVIDFFLMPHMDASGNVDFLVSSGIDITERKNQELSLRAAHDSFYHLVTSSPFGICAVDADFRLAMVSAGAQKLFENVRPLIGRDFAEALRIIWPEPHVSEAIAIYRHTLETGEPYRAPGTVERRNDIGKVESYDWKIERVTLPDGRPGIVCHFYDLSEREEFDRALLESELRFRSTFENAGVGIGHISKDGRWLRANQRLCDIIGYTKCELSELTFQDITASEDLDKELVYRRQIQANTRDNYQMQKRYRRKDGSIVWVRLSVSCVRDDDGDVNYFISIVEDISKQQKAEKRQELLIRELNHRVKNSLATIQAMASQTIRSSDDMEQFSERFSGRLRAMAMAHDSIFDGNDLRADLKAAIRNQLFPYLVGEHRLEMTGPQVYLDTETAHALGLILHELATNACKYGALSNDTGRIAVSWQHLPADGASILQLTWCETGGPQVAPPEKAGFGSRLIDTTIQQTLNGTSTVDYLPQGARYEFRFTLENQDRY